MCMHLSTHTYIHTYIHTYATLSLQATYRGHSDAVTSLTQTHSHLLISGSLDGTAIAFHNVSMLVFRRESILGLIACQTQLASRRHGYVLRHSLSHRAGPIAAL